MRIRLALPKGRLQGGIASLLKEGGLVLEDYGDGSRSYRPRAPSFPDLFIKVFQEKDIPIQVSIGNYDVGICGLDWAEEYLVRYPESALVKVLELGIQGCELYVVVASASPIVSVEDLRRISSQSTVRIVSEYGNLAEAFVFQNRLRRFRVFPVWGAAQAYLPENAEVALVANGSREDLAGRGLRPLSMVLVSQAVVIANRDSFARQDLSPFLALIRRVRPADVG